MRLNRRNLLIAVCLVAVAAALCWVFYEPLAKAVVKCYNTASDKEALKAFVESYGAAAPLVFVLLQILQVVFSPIPGELTGFMGGYIFGAAGGFIWSTIGLSIGSALNFLIGRFFGKRYVRKLIPEKHLKRFDAFIKRQGVPVMFILFVVPGFPKDYLCLFLGLSAMSWKVFIFIASVGRMPGTFILSLQGECLFNGMYVQFAVILAICAVLGFAGYKYREELYGFLEKLDNQGNKETLK